MFELGVHQWPSQGRLSDEGETLIAPDLRAGEAKLGLGRRPESWEWSGQPVRSIWTDFQPKPLILDPVRTNLMFLGRTGLWPGPDKPCCCWEVLPQALFFRENGHPGFDKPCAAGESCRRRFFFR